MDITGIFRVRKLSYIYFSHRRQLTFQLWRTKQEREDLQFIKAESLKANSSSIKAEKIFAFRVKAGTLATISISAFIVVSIFLHLPHTHHVE